jgi:hypothetical protein
MPRLVFHSQATCTCSHGGQLQIAPAQTRALVGGRPIATTSATLTVLGCPGVSGAVCTTAVWVNASSRVLADSQPVLLQAPPPVPGNGTVAGPPPNIPLVIAMQTKVVGT